MNPRLGYYMNKYVKAVRQCYRWSEEKAMLEFNRSLDLFKSDEDKFIEYILMEIEYAKRDLEWRRRHVIRSRWE